MMNIATRVGSFAQRTSLVQQMMKIQKNLYDTQTQLSTEQKSQNYTGLSADTFRLVTLENDKSQTKAFIQSNTIANTRLKAMTSSVDAVDDRVRTMRSDLVQLMNREFGDPLTDEDLDALEDIQVRAFATLQDVNDYLSTKVDGRYLFSGGRTDENPVYLPYTNLEDFQATYDGTDITFPVTRGSNVSDIELANTEHGGLTFAAGPPSTITVGNAASIADLEPGTLITLDDPDIGKTQFTVTGVDTGTGVLTVSPSLTAGEVTNLNTNAADATLKTVSYYKGDSLTFQHRVSENRTIAIGITAKDAAFEKAIRALGILAQGNLDAPDTTTAAGTTGTLTFDNTTGSVTAATSGSFSGLAVGSSITFPGTANNASQTFTITANDGDTLTLEPPPNNETGVASDAVSSNLGRLDYARNLLNDAIDHDTSNTNELAGDLESVARTIGFHQVTLQTEITRAQDYEVFLASRQGDIEGINRTEVSAMLLAQADSLNLSYQAYSRVSQLSLNDYL